MDRFEIVTAKRKNDKLKKERHAGVSIYKEEDGVYKIHLSILPNVTYFMQKNRHNEYFTIFSKKTRNGQDSKLLNPVGRGSILNNLKTHMRLHFEVLNTTLYMSLFPKV